MNMKTPEEIKKGLYLCNSEGYGCLSCPYHGDCEGQPGLDAFDYIRQLEDTIGKMILQMRGDCGVCKHRHAQDAAFRSAAKHGDFAMTDICAECIRKEARPNWEYEGLPEV
jgi:hypothetical protein